MKKFLALSVAAFALAFAVPQALSAADDAATIKKNMADRKPKIEVLKKAGSIGENKSGYLEAMKDAKLEDADRKLLEDENADRKAVYTDIAKQQSAATGKKVTVEIVAETRARQIRSRAKEGEYVQTEDGKWVKTAKPAEKKDEKKDK